MCKRIFYTLNKAWKYRKELREYQKNSALQANTLLDLDILTLKSQGIQALVLDFDGVLSAYGDEKPYKQLNEWLKLSVEIWGAGNVFILSNKPLEVRHHYFSHHFPGIDFIVAPRKKPYPDGLLKILQKLKIDPKALLVIDDRLLTGLLATILVGARGCLILKPWVHLSQRPVQELFFMVLRKLERWYF